MQIKVDFLCRDSILAAPIVLDLVLLVDLAKRCSELRGRGIQEWLSFYFKSPMTVPGLYPEHDLFLSLIHISSWGKVKVPTASWAEAKLGAKFKALRAKTAA